MKLNQAEQSQKLEYFRIHKFVLYCRRKCLIKSLQSPLRIQANVSPSRFRDGSEHLNLKKNINTVSLKTGLSTFGHF